MATVVAHDASFAGQVELSDAYGVVQLTELGSHIEAAEGSVVLSE